MSSTDLWSSNKPQSWIRDMFLPGLAIIALPMSIQLLQLMFVKYDASIQTMMMMMMNNKSSSFLILMEAIEIPSFYVVFTMIGFFLFELFVLMCFPGEGFFGPKAPSGYVPFYERDNGPSAFYLTHIVWMILDHFDIVSLSFFAQYLGQVITFLNICGLLLALYLYIKGFRSPSSDDFGDSGNVLLTFYWGAELYPRIFGNVSLKQLVICRYGIMLWSMFCVSFVFPSSSFHTNGQILSAALILSYCCKFFYFERYYLCAADIAIDRFGFMLSWGTIVFMPLVHTLQNLFLMTHPGLSMNGYLCITLYIFGVCMIWVNYDSDTQRHFVREHDGEVLVWGKKPKIIRAKYNTLDGKIHHTILLCSGWNGISRHFHYLPDIILLFLYCLPCGFTHLFPWMYFFYLTILLLDRTNRIDERMAVKYGIYWHQYCEVVPYKLVPNIY